MRDDAVLGRALPLDRGLGPHASVNLVYDSKTGRRFYQSTGRPKRTEQNLIARIGISEAEVTNNKRLHLRYCTA